MDVRTLCLGALTERDMTGYEIKHCFEEAFRHFFVAGYGSIYPALAELTREGLVDVTSVEQVKRPDKKVYSITDNGLAALKETLAATAPRHKVRSEFLALMYFSHLLPPERVIEVIDQMTGWWRHVLLQDLATVERDHEQPGATPLTPGMRFALGYGRTMMSTAIAYCERHRAELERELARVNGNGHELIGTQINAVSPERVHGGGDAAMAAGNGFSERPDAAREETGAQGKAAEPPHAAPGE